MTMTATTVRRGLYGMFAGGLLAFGSAAIVMPVAGAEPNTTHQLHAEWHRDHREHGVGGYRHLSDGAPADQPGADGYCEAAD